MLILTRRVGETLMIGDEVSVTVLGVKGNQVRLGVNAPKDIAVHREEIYQRILHERTGHERMGYDNHPVNLPPMIEWVKTAVVLGQPVIRPSPKSAVNPLNRVTAVSKCVI